MLRDIGYALRVLLQSKLWSLIVILSLALGIGANTALFSATNGLMLRKLPVDDPDSLVRFRNVGRNQMANSTSDYGNTSADGDDTRATFSYPMFLEFRKHNQTLGDLVAGAPMGSVNLVIDGKADIASGYIASGNYHRMLGVRAVLGRVLSPDDDRSGAPPVAVISEGLWNRRFGRDPNVVGKVVQANNTPLTIVGVVDPKFTGMQRPISNAPDLTFPLAIDPLLNPVPVLGTTQPPRVDQPTYWWLQVMGRLKAGVTAAQVQGNLEGLFQQAARQGMESYLGSLTDKERGMTRNRNRTDVPRLRVSSGAQGVYDNDARTLRSVAILSGVVALILLIVCANVANLLLSRAAARQKEISVRLSIGATRTRLVRQLLTESVMLACLGGAAGIGVAYWGKRLLPGAAGQAPLDWRVLLFTWGLVLITGVLFGIAPALRTTGEQASAALKETSRTVVGSRTLLGKSLLVIQVAVSLILLIGAGLFLRTVENLRQVDVGFNPRNLVLFRVNPGLNRYDAQRTSSLYERMVQRLQAVPGVRSVTLSNPAMLSGSVNGTSFIVQGRPFSEGRHNDVNRVTIAPNFFEAMEIPLLLGRVFTDRDNRTAPRVAVINDAAVKKFFKGENPLGSRFGSSPETSGDIEIVGVVRDIKYNDIREPAPATMYVPYAQQSGSPAMSFEVRTAGDPSVAVPSIREAVREVDADVPLMAVSTQLEQIEQRFSQERIFAQAYALFGGLALIVASIGLFGLMSYSVARRTNEIGIRMALGAERVTVLQMVLRESLTLVVIGVVVGLIAAVAAGRLVAALLFGLAPTDVTTIAVAMAVMLAVSAFAGYLPARRASRVDPMMALRYE